MYQRYGNPIELLDSMLDTGRLTEFVGGIFKIVHEEKEGETLWEYWLHKDFMRSWKEFLDSRNDTQHAAPTQDETVAIVKDSMDIMASFRPDSGGVTDGAIPAVRGDTPGCVESGQDA